MMYWYLKPHLDPPTSKKLLLADFGHWGRSDWLLPFSLCPPTYFSALVTLCWNYTHVRRSELRMVCLDVNPLSPLTLPSYLSFYLILRPSSLCLFWQILCSFIFCLKSISSPSAYFIFILFYFSLTQKHFIPLHFEVTPFPRFHFRFFRTHQVLEVEGQIHPLWLPFRKTY